MKESTIENAYDAHLLDLLLSAPMPPPWVNFPPYETFGVETVDSVRLEKIMPLRQKIPFSDPERYSQYRLCYGLRDQKVTNWLELTKNDVDQIVTKRIERKDIPDDFKLSFYNEIPVKKRSYRIILTDHPIIAYYMMNFSSFKTSLELIWVSFWTPDHNLDRLDWHIFKDRQIYYYVYCHSGNNRKQTRDNALRILEILRPSSGKAIASEVNFIVHECDDKVPMFSSEKAFLEMDEKNIAEDTPAPFPEIQQFPYISRKILIDPFVLEKTITFFYDGAAKDRTQLVLDLVIAASQKKTSIQNVSPPKVPLKIIYIHQTIGSDNFYKKMQDSFAKQSLSPNPHLISNLHMIPTELLVSENGIVPYDPAIRCRQYPGNSDDSNNASGGNRLKYFDFKCNIQNGGAVIDIISKILSPYSEDELVVIDIPYLFDYIAQKEWGRFNHFLSDLRRRYTVIISTDIYYPRNTNMVLNLPIDTIFHVQRMKAKNPEDILLKLNVERIESPTDKLFSRAFQLLFSPSHSSPQWLLQPRRQYTKVEMVNFIRKHNKMKLRDIALLLGVSESYVKKLRREAGLARATPQRSPKKKQPWVI